jgi:hypothetical protein
VHHKDLNEFHLPFLPTINNSGNLFYQLEGFFYSASYFISCQVPIIYFSVVFALGKT